jgi:hypothetical protein
VVVFKAKVTEFPLFIVKVIALGPSVPVFTFAFDFQGMVFHGSELTLFIQLHGGNIFLALIIRQPGGNAEGLCLQNGNECPPPFLPLLKVRQASAKRSNHKKLMSYSSFSPISEFIFRATGRMASAANTEAEDMPYHKTETFRKIFIKRRLSEKILIGKESL